MLLPKLDDITETTGSGTRWYYILPTEGEARYNYRTRTESENRCWQNIKGTDPRYSYIQTSRIYTIYFYISTTSTDTRLSYISTPDNATIYFYINTTGNDTRRSCINVAGSESGCSYHNTTGNDIWYYYKNTRGGDISCSHEAVNKERD